VSGLTSRREFITLLVGTAAMGPLAARAQQAALPVIGFLVGFSRESEMPFLPGFRRGLIETGYTEGQNVAVEYRFADLHFDRLPALAEELVRRRVAVIVSTGGVRSTAAAVAATKTIPIVSITGIDPVKLGWVRSFNHPGGNVTAVSFLSNALEAKRLGLLHDAIPRVAIVGVLSNRENPTSEQQTKDLNEAAHTLGLTLHFAHVGRESDVEPAFSSVLQRGAQAIAVATDANFLSWREQFVGLTARARVPAIFHDREFAVRGGLLSYGASITEAHRLAGIYAGRILKGDKPSDLPVQQSTRVEFVINLATAKSLGLEIPSGVLAIADEVIE
jgi:putative tryptophan/tyrosine transport system substrate-binding protein